jgi:hypothetical protein
MKLLQITDPPSVTMRNTVPTLYQNETGETRVEELPSLASLAAIELDDLVIGRADIHLDAVRRLAKALASWVQSEGEGSAAVKLDPSRLFVINRAFEDSTVIERRPTTVDELVQITTDLTRSLENLTSEQRDKHNLERLRSFCLALSRRAASLVYGREEREPRHPYRQ